MPYPFADLEYLTAPNLNAAFAAEINARTAAFAAEAVARNAAITAEVAARNVAIAAEAAARGVAMGNAISGLRPRNLRSLGIAQDGVTDDYPVIQAALDAAGNDGGGDVYLPAWRAPCLITQTLCLWHPGVKLIGDAIDCSHDYTPSWPSNANTAPVSGLLWGGAAGADMIQVAPLNNSDNGAGIGGNGVVDIVLFAGVYPFSSVAAHGVTVMAARAGEYRIFGLEFSDAALFMSTLSRNPAWNNSSWFNTVSYLGSRNISTAGGALRMNGVSGAGNAYDNRFGIIDALHNNGTAVNLQSADNNIFDMTRIQRVPGGTGVGVWFQSAAQVDMPARANIFRLLSPGAGGVYSDAQQSFPPYENKIEYYNPDENNAPAVPLIGTGSTLFWKTTKRSGSCTFQATMAGSQSVPSGVWTKVLFNAVLYDEATWYDTGNSVWRPRYPGSFLFLASVLVTPGAVAGTVQLRIVQNGGAGAGFRVSRVTRGSGSDTISISGIIGLNGTTDTVEVDLYQDSGSPATIVASTDEGYFQGARVG